MRWISSAVISTVVVLALASAAASSQAGRAPTQERVALDPAWQLHAVVSALYPEVGKGQAFWRCGFQWEPFNTVQATQQLLCSIGVQRRPVTGTGAPDPDGLLSIYGHFDSNTGGLWWFSVSGPGVPMEDVLAKIREEGDRADASNEEVSRRLVEAGARFGTPASRAALLAELSRLKSLGWLVGDFVIRETEFQARAGEPGDKRLTVARWRVVLDARRRGRVIGRYSVAVEPFEGRVIDMMRIPNI